MKRSKPGVSTAQAHQREYVRRRSMGRCEFEVVNVLQRDADHKYEFMRCGNPGGETAHIYRRWKTGKARDLPAVVIDACHRCHTKYDAYHKDVRPPLAYQQLAWDAIVADAKDIKSTLSILGERPCTSVAAATGGTPGGQSTREA